jgi:immune inhibitor A
MQEPPWSGFAQRRRIFTDDPQAVNWRRWVAILAFGLVSLAAARTASAAETRAINVLALLAAFPDRPLAKQREHFVGHRTALVDRLIAYYREVSSGRLEIVPTVGQTVVTLPQRRAAYVQHPDAIARDALAAFATAASEPAEREALARADALLVFFAGAGRESHTSGGDPTDPWSNYVALVPPAEAPGSRAFDEAIVIAEREVRPFSSFGVLCHEFGHFLGLPELYAPGGLAQEGIGVWGLMGQGTWLRRGERPPHPCAWSKLRLGWVDVQTIERSAPGLELPAVETAPRVIRIPAVPGGVHEYYLLENRARIGADRRLPGAGLLVWHVDESVEGFRSAQTNVARKLLHLVEADGRGDLDRGHAAGGNRGDATDPWQGPPRWRRAAGASLLFLGALLVAGAAFRVVRPRALRPVLGLLGAAGLSLAGGSILRHGPVCGLGTPGMAPHDGSPVRLVIRNISPAGPLMRFDVLVAPVPAAH